MRPTTVSRLALALAFLAGLASSAPAETVRATSALDKSAMLRGIEERAEETWRAALDLWEWAEPGYQETRSAKRLAAQLEQRGFRVERGVADIPTAFVATFGSGEPVLGILAEFDATSRCSSGISHRRSTTATCPAGVCWGGRAGRSRGSDAGALLLSQPWRSTSSKS